MRKQITVIIIISATFITLFSCKNEAFNPRSNTEKIVSPLPKYTPIPKNNPQTTEKIALGKQLFYDPILSGNKDVACATCHHPLKGYADALDLSVGVGGIGLGEQRKGKILAKRNAHTILNTAYNGFTISDTISPEKAPMFWDNRVLSLEEQALQPPLSKEEMRGTKISEKALYDTIVKRLNNIPAYKLAFKNAFGSEEITTDKIAKAIASFERTLIAYNSPFDQYMRGDTTAMTQKQINGMNAFVNVGCAVCHNGPMFSDYKLHTLGVPDNPKLPKTDAGTGSYAFRTPTLRNLAYTAPYMHNGIYSTLEEVMEFYEAIGEGNNGDNDDNTINQHLTPNQITPLARQIQMDDDVTDEIIDFLNALNDPNFDKSIPKNVPSNLPVGGKIK